MKNSFLSVSTGLIALGFLFAGCTPSSKQLKEAIEKDPTIVFSAIEKDPEGFFKVVMQAQKQAQEGGAQKQAQEEQKKRDEEFNNPLKPEIEANRAVKGNKDAPITVVEYSDFECPFCKRGAENVKKVLDMYPNQIRFVYKHLPLDFHPKAMPAAKYFEAVVRQSHEKAYKFHDYVFENQEALKKDGEKFLKDAAKKVGANLSQLDKDLKDPKLMDRITADMEEAKKFNFSGTPGYLVNGVSIRGAFPPEEFKVIIDRHLANVKK